MLALVEARSYAASRAAVNDARVAARAHAAQPRAVSLRRLSLVAFVVLFLAPSCARESPSTLLDSTGVEALWECSRGDCEITRASEIVPSCGERAWYVVGAGALAVLCVDVGGEVDPATCRPIVCDSDLDCPQWEARGYGCDGGFCSTSALGLDHLDVVATCLATTPREPSCALTDAATARIAIAEAACAEGAIGCTIPEACLP